MKRYALHAALLILAVLLLAACEPEVGSEEWCVMMNEKAKGDWTFSETGDYARHCVVR